MRGLFCVGAIAALVAACGANPLPIDSKGRPTISIARTPSPTGIIPRLSGTPGGNEIPATPAVVDDLKSRLKPDCYTVDLFGTNRVEKPSSDVPAENAAFLGVWGNGAWNGEWCHDIYVLDVRADGTATIVDTHGYFDKYGQVPSAFKRTARIEKGVLRFAHGLGIYRYQIIDGFLVGESSGRFGDLTVVLSRKGA